MSSATATSSTSSTSSSSSSWHIFDAHSWEPTKLKLGQIKQNRGGQGKSIAFSHEGKKWYLKTPKMRCPFGASTPPEKYTKDPNNPNWNAQLSFGTTEEEQLFQQKIAAFDRFLIDQATRPEHSTKWLGAPKRKPFSREVVESKYTSSMKWPKTREGDINPNYPPYMRVNFPTAWREPGQTAPPRFSCELYDSKGNLVQTSPNPQDPNCIKRFVTPGCHCSALLEAKKIWVTGTGFGVSWRVVQLKVYQNERLPTGECLLDDDHHEEAEELEDPEEPESDEFTVETTSSDHQVEFETEEDPSVSKSSLRLRS